METIEQRQYRQSVNKKLWRPIKSGKEYAGLIPSFQNLVHQFDKEEDYSNTYDTLEFMAQWTKKYANQMSKIAPILKGATLGETCNNIYKFLYWHFQYALDGNVQDLHSPSSAWRNRQTGFDCKTYSILAGCILENLKIPYSFRMVQLSEPIWSHVYVVVPNGNNYFVIDATKHENTEVKFSKKYDKIMIHRGLANPLVNTMLGCPGVECSCSGKPTKVSGLGNPQTLQNTINNLHTFLNKLDKAGVPRRITNNVLTIVRQNIEQGIDPNMNEVFQKAIMYNLPQNIGLGVSFGEVVTAGTSAYTGDLSGIKSLISNLIPTSFLSSTFGSVFSNNFMLSCWGASLTPAMASENITKNHKPHFEYRLAQIQNATSNSALQTALNEFIKDAYILHKYYTVYKPVSANWSGCAKKAINEGYVPFMKAIKTKADQLITEFTLKGATIRQEKIQPIDFWFRKSITGNADIDEIRNEADTAFADYPQLTLSAFTVPTGTTGTTTTNNNASVVDNGNGTVTVTNPSTGQSTTITKDQAIAQGVLQTNQQPKTTTGNSYVLPTVVVGGLAAWMLFRPSKDVTKQGSKKSK